MPSRILKAEIDSLTEHLQRNPTYEKREGEALTSPGNPLANLTTVKLSRIRSPETSGRKCVESMLCKVHPELYIPSLTHPTRNAPNLYPFKRLGVLCWFEAESRMVFWCGSLIWWADLVGCWLVWLGRWVWRSALVGCCSCLVWRLDLVVCFNGLNRCELLVWCFKWSDGGTISELSESWKLKNID